MGVTETEDVVFLDSLRLTVRVMYYESFDIISNCRSICKFFPSISRFTDYAIERSKTLSCSIEPLESFSDLASAFCNDKLLFVLANSRRVRSNEMRSTCESESFR